MEDLVQVLSQVPVLSHPDLLVGTETGDDAAVYRLNDHTSLILTVDFFTPITDDPFDFGSIAAANSFSDVYAMGGKPLLALNVVGFPADLAKDMLGEVLRGGYAKAAEAGCLIVGGQTVDDPEPKYGPVSCWSGGTREGSHQCRCAAWGSIGTDQALGHRNYYYRL